MTTGIRTRVLVIEKDDLVRQSYGYIINSAQKLVVVGLLSNFSKSIEEVRIKKPDVIVTDVTYATLPLLEQLRDKFPYVKVLIRSNEVEYDFISKVFRIGVSGYLLKADNYHELLESFDEISRGGAPMSRAIARTVVTSFHVNTDSPLTKRENQVISLLAEGKTYVEISRNLAISKETARSHINNIYRKLNAKSRSEAIAVATQKKYIVMT